MINLFNIFWKEEKTSLILDEFLRQIRSNGHLNTKESRENLEENLIELTYYGYHSSNGLLFTNRGYFITAKHCVNDLNGLKAKLYNGKNCTIEKICAVSNKSDIAIGKINLPKKYSPKMFKTYNTDKLEKIPLVLLTRINGEIKEKYGFVNRDWSPSSYKLANLFESKNLGKPGDSGGILVSPEGELIGIHRGSTDNSTMGTCIKINRILDLIEFYKNKKLK